MTLTKVTNSMISGAPVNILDFGAVSGQDSTAAIQAAINYAALNNTYTVVPAGSFIVTGLTVPATGGFDLRGYGQMIQRTLATDDKISEIVFTGGSGDFLTAALSTGLFRLLDIKLTSPADFAYSFVTAEGTYDENFLDIRRVTFNNPYTSVPTGVAIKLTATGLTNVQYHAIAFGHVQDIWAYGCAKVLYCYSQGVDSGSSTPNFINGNYFYNITGFFCSTLIHFEGVSGGDVANNTVVGGMLQPQNYTVGIKLENADFNMISGITIFDIVGAYYGITLDANCQFNTVQGWFGNTGFTGIEDLGTTNISITPKQSNFIKVHSSDLYTDVIHANTTDLSLIFAGELSIAPAGNQSVGFDSTVPIKTYTAGASAIHIEFNSVGVTRWAICPTATAFLIQYSADDGATWTTKLSVPV